MKKNIIVKIDNELHKKFKLFCINQDLTISEALRRLIDNALFTGKIEYIEDGTLDQFDEKVVDNPMEYTTKVSKEQMKIASNEAQF